MKVLDLFSGIGGFSLGLERAGMETVAFCEFDEHARKVLKKHWPDVPIHNDVRELDGKQYRGSVDVVCGGFPCQDLSTAGKQAGFDGERSSLYREMLRIISECMPKYAIFENVAALISGDNGRWFARFLYDLAEVGYDAEWHCISASFIGAPHHRDRVWIIAYPNNDGHTAAKERQGFQEGNGGDAKRAEPACKPERLFIQGVSSNAEIINDWACDSEQGERQKPKFRDCFSSLQIPTDTNLQRCKGFAKIAHLLKQQVEFVRSATAKLGGFNLSEPPLCGTNDGVPGRSHRLKQLGNAVVPQIPEAIGRAIMQVEANS